jgi:uncharacterized protein (TIGR02757 family)
MNKKELKEFLDLKAVQYNGPAFVREDPISIPHSFSKKEDIEIIGFLAATIAWGQRKTIIRNAQSLATLMEHEPHDFILNHTSADLARFDSFVHRTFNAIDCRYFMSALAAIYRDSGGLETVFTSLFKSHDNASALSLFKAKFFELDHEKRTEKHVADPLKGSSAKRLNMYLRWMVRKDDGGVDFGLWNDIPTSRLSLPLDVHTGNVARKLKLLKRKQNDWKAVQEVDEALRKMDPVDPCKYDFALFGLGVYESF